MRNYISFYYQDRQLIAEIHKQGKYRIVNNPEDVKELIEIAKIYGYHIHGECLLNDNIFSISRKFEQYLEEKKKPLHVIGNIVSNMKLSKKNIPLGKTIVSLSLATVLIANGISLTADDNTISSDIGNDITTEQTINTEDLQDNSTENTFETDNIDLMIQEDEFHFNYEDRSDSDNIQSAERYEDLFELYGNRYGIDKNLLMALVAQESAGEHYENLDNGPAEGIMQIEVEAHIDSTVTAYNTETGEMDTVYVSPEALQDLESNIQIGTMLFRNCLEESNYNIPLALQTYNFGPGNMAEVLETCCETENIDENDLKNNTNNSNWLNYREFLDIGDSQYVEHVFSYLPNNTTIYVQDRQNNPIEITICNDYYKTNQY